MDTLLDFTYYVRYTNAPGVEELGVDKFPLKIYVLQHVGSARKMSL